ncbi:MAG: hypothetical protein J6333_11995, partial [Planctomycetes bacterium]|nr:hypothetical protein [Planctomycetota bacterium]
YVRALRPGDRWNVVKFSEKVYPFRQGFIAAGEPLPPDFARFFSRPLNEYMTDLFEATRVALQGLPPDARPCNVFLLTDGFATYGRKEVDQLLSGFRRVNRDRFSILPFMLGDKGMADLLKLLAYSSRGFFRRQVGGKDAAAAEMLAFFRDYDRPALFACVANFTGLDGKEVYPEVLPNLYHGQAVTFHGRAEMSPGALVRVIGWGPNHAPREFYFRPEQGRAYPTGDERIRREWAFGAAMDHVQAIVEAPDAAARKGKLTNFRAFLARHGLGELNEMANLLEKNR